MQHQTAPRLRTQKGAFYGIQDPITGLYARIKDEPPATAQPAEESAGAVAARHGHVRFERWPTATWFISRPQAEAAFAHFFGCAPLDIVRRDA